MVRFLGQSSIPAQPSHFFHPRHTRLLAQLFEKWWQIILWQMEHPASSHAMTSAILAMALLRYLVLVFSSKVELKWKSMFRGSWSLWMVWKRCAWHLQTLGGIQILQFLEIISRRHTRWSMMLLREWLDLLLKVVS